MHQYTTDPRVTSFVLRSILQRGSCLLCAFFHASLIVGCSGDGDYAQPAAPGQVGFARTTVENGQAPWGKAVADLDGDGFMDVIEGGGNLKGNIYWYRYPSWMKFQIGAVGGDDDLQVGDINGDGATDVIVNGGIYWYENPRGSGKDVENLWARHAIDANNNAHDLVVGDVNGDNKLDIVTRGEFGPTTLYLQNTPDSWIKVRISNAPDGEGTALADIDRDGHIDIVGNGYWLQQPPDPTKDTWIKHDFGTWPAGAAVAVADINNDGRIDIFLSASEVGVGLLAWFEAPIDPVNGIWVQHDIDIVEDIHKFHVVDVNADGKGDIVFAEMHQSKTKRVGVYYNKGDGAVWALQVLAATGGHNIAVGDIDNDGDTDILVANWAIDSPDGGRLNLWRNDLAPKLRLETWTHIQVDNTRAHKSFGLAFGDIDGDGLRDIIAGPYWYRNPGGKMTGFWSRTTFGSALDAMLTMDLDSDGRLDVIAQGAPIAGSVPVHWLKPVNKTGTDWNDIAIGSIPADPVDGTSQGYAAAQLVPGGQPEIIFSSVGINYFQVPSHPSSETWPRVPITSEAREEGIAVGDIDGDGDMDVVGFVSPAGTVVAWWENPGTSAANWARHELGTTSGVEGDRIAIADIDGDGKRDVIVTETNLDPSGNSVYWFRQGSNPRSGAWPRNTVAANQGSLNSMDVADMNRDGKPDIITGEHRGSLRVIIWENVGAGSSWVKHIVSEGFESHLGTRVIDLDRDGDLDIVSIAWDANKFLHVWRNDAIR